MSMLPLPNTEIQSADYGVIADALINFLDANWSVYTRAQRDELISEAERFHTAAVKRFLD